jgi:hypothetical protein
MRQLSDLAARGGVNLGPRGSDFTRAAMALAACEGLNDAAAYAANRWGATSRAANVVKAVISAVTSGSAAGTALVSEGGAHEFFSAVAETTIVGRLGGALRRVPLQCRVIGTTGSGVAYWVTEGAAKALSPMLFTSDILRPMKVMGLAVATKETLESSDPQAEAVFRRELLNAVIAEMDTTFIDPANAGVADVMPASVTNGVTPVAGTASPTIGRSSAPVAAPCSASR